MYKTKSFFDIVYGETPERRLTLDIIKPDSVQTFPAIIFVHGGGWMAGDKSKIGGEWNASFAEHGFVCININFRLSGEAIFPAPLLDVKTAIRWVKENASKYNINQNKIGIWGHSSGGHLSTLAALSANRAEFSTDHSISDAVNAFVSLAGPVDLLEMGSWHNNPNSPESKFVGGSIQQQKEVAFKANPINYINEDLPPSLLIHGDNDQMCPVEQSRKLYTSLPNSSYLEIKGADHDFIAGVLTMNEILVLVRSFFTKTLVNGLMSKEEYEKHQQEVEHVMNWFKDRSL